VNAVVILLIQHLNCIFSPKGPLVSQNKKPVIKSVGALYVKYVFVVWVQVEYAVYQYSKPLSIVATLMHAPSIYRGGHATTTPACAPQSVVSG
jgi:hypothetical protein